MVVRIVCRARILGESVARTVLMLCAAAPPTNNTCKIIINVDIVALPMTVLEVCEVDKRGLLLDIGQRLTRNGRGGRRCSHAFLNAIATTFEC